MATQLERKELFISYGREPEVIQFVTRLKGDLEEHGFSVWMDVHDISAGSDWHGAIGTGLTQCRAIVPIITNKYIGSRYCTNELYTADGDKKAIFPIMFEDVDFSTNELARGVKFVISGVNWTMCRPGVDDYNSAISKLMQGMKEKGLGGGDYEDDEGSGGPPAHRLPAKPLVGPVSSQPFKVIPDVESPEGIASSAEGHLVVSTMKHKVIIFDKEHEKILEIGGDPGLGMGQFLSPSGVVVDGDGNILVAGHYFVQKFSKDGKFLQQAGGTVGASFSIESPRAMAIGKGGRIYITEQQKHQVKVLNPDLTLYKTFTNACRTLGSGHLNMPQGIAVNSEGNVYVADMMNHVIQVFDPEGEYLFKFGKMGSGIGCTTSPSALIIDKDDNVYVGSGTCSVSIFNSKGDFIRSFGECGSELGKFNQIGALHIDMEGLLYVGECTSNRIQIFRLTGYNADPESTEGQGVGLVSAEVTAPQQSSGAQMVAVPPENIEHKQTTFTTSKSGVVTSGPNVTFGSKSVITTGDGTTIIGGTVRGPGTVKPVMDAGARGALIGSREVEQGSQPDVVFAKSANAACKRAGSTKLLKVLPNIKNPISIAIGKNAEIVVSVRGNPSIIIFNEKYEQVSEVHDDTLSHCCVAVDSSNTILAFGTRGIKKFDMSGQELLAISQRDKPDLQFCSPHAVAIGEKERMYIADIGAEKIYILDREFNYIKSFAEECIACGVAVNSVGNVYVAVTKQSTIRVFTSEGDALFQFGGPGRKPLPQFSLMAPMSVAIDANNMVYVGTVMSTITVFDKDGTFQEKIGSKGSKPGQFKRCPVPLCIDDKGKLYVGEQNGDKIQIFQI